MTAGPAGGPPVVDAHLHVWQPSPGRYGWLAHADTRLRRDYAFADARPALSAAGVGTSVLVQAENNTADTIAMLGVADAEPAVRGVVGWTPLANPVACEAALDRLADDRHLVGVRHLVHDEPDPDWVIQPAVLRSLTVLARRGLPFDLVAVLPRHLEHAATLARAIPDLTIVIDHLAKPPIRDHGWQPWAGLLAAAAAHDNVVAKVSGLNSAADPDRWTVEHLRPYVEHALDVFGPCRLMYGGDWPLTVTAGGYAKNWQATRALISGLSHAEQAQVLGGTANAVYQEGACH